jgi:hypothetical protein
MSTLSSQPTDGEGQRITHKKRWVKTVLVITSTVFLCIASLCVLTVIRIIDSTKPKTRMLYYQDASINHMFEICNTEGNNHWENWPQPMLGSDTVLVIVYSKSIPLPDAFYNYNLFIQIDPVLVVPGNELSLAAQGVKSFLVDSPAPLLFCSYDLSGSIKILEVSDQAIKALLDVAGTVNHNPWQYNGVAEYKLSFLP